jgi:hypothetical protein
MPIIRRAAVGAVGVALAAALSACSGTPSGGVTPSESATPPPSARGPSPGTPSGGTQPPLSSTELPTLKPAKPPKTPTDRVPTDLIVGRVTRGGSGPCYGVIDEDGTHFAVYSTAGMSLGVGATVRIRFEQPKRTIDCGAGRPIQAIQIAIVG